MLDVERALPGKHIGWTYAIIASEEVEPAHLEQRARRVFAEREQVPSVDTIARCDCLKPADMAIGNKPVNAGEEPSDDDSIFVIGHVYIY